MRINSDGCGPDGRRVYHFDMGGSDSSPAPAPVPAPTNTTSTSTSSSTALTDPIKRPFLEPLWGRAVEQSKRPARSNPFLFGVGGNSVSSWTDRNNRDMSVRPIAPVDWNRYFPTDVVRNTASAAAGGHVGSDSVQHYDFGGPVNAGAPTSVPTPAASTAAATPYGAGVSAAGENAAAAANAVTGFTRPQDSQSPYTPSSASFNDPGVAAQYTNPYDSAVTERGVQEAHRNFDINRTKSDAAATQAGAFGGYRQGIQNAEEARNEGQLESDIRAKGNADSYNQARANWGTDAARTAQGEQSAAQLRLQSQVANMDNAYKQAGVELSAGQLNQSIAAQKASAAAQAAQLAEQSAQRTSQEGIQAASRASQAEIARAQNETAQRAQDLNMSQFQTNTSMQIMDGLAKQFGAIDQWPLAQIQAALAALK